ncbi:MAG TPA: acyl carrier protein [Clostridiales bacterium]|nr:acyl carrier protein [Clostridiales bacterium]
MSAFDKLREMISRITGVSASTITPDTTIKQLNMDSMDVCELVSTVEDEFDVLICNEENIQTVNDLMVQLGC